MVPGLMNCNELYVDLLSIACRVVLDPEPLLGLLAAAAWHFLASVPSLLQCSWVCREIRLRGLGLWGF